MPLELGTRLGAYEITGAIGAGGMGEVYRARDTKLGREVAIKVLPDEFSQDKDRLARFEREAKLLASLNHANIATLYGLEHWNGRELLIMELVEGETLAERVAKGPIPVDEAIPLLVQIAEGLEAAHEKGIIHRDLKPANIKVTTGGKVKVLDFGLAKAFEDEVLPADLSQSPTVTRQGTRAGVIMGTAAYMSPEQTKGKPLDRRTDIWAFGCCGYEVLTGRSAFGGETVSEVLANVLKGEPAWEWLPADTPPRLAKLLTSCLAKDARYRLRDIGDAWVALQQEDEETSAPPRQPRRPAARALGVLLVIAAAFSVGRTVAPTRTATETPKRFVLELGESIIVEHPSLALSPDGEILVYAGQIDGERHLFLRRLNELEGRRLPGTERAAAPFFSPDGASIGFLTFSNTQGTVVQGEVKKMALSEGLPVTLAQWTGAEAAFGSTGAFWGDDGFIVFPSENGAGLSRVPQSGGPVDVLTEPSGAGAFHADPHVLPGARAILFRVQDDESGRRIAVRSPDSGEQRILAEDGFYPWYVPSGHILYFHGAEQKLVAAPFDLDTLEVTGQAVPVLENVSDIHRAVSRDGTLVFRSLLSSKSLWWVDRRGDERPLKGFEGDYLLVRVGPSGNRAAVSYWNTAGIWIHDFDRNVSQLLAVEPSGGIFPVWSPEGNGIAYVRRGDLYITNVDGAGAAERLTESSKQRWPYSFSPDGSYLVYEDVTPQGGNIAMLAMDGTGTMRTLIDRPLDQTNPAVSPDGRWLAYESNESGRIEVFVQAFPEGSQRWQVSTEGGTVPVWNPRGRELFYRSGQDMMVVPVETSETFSAGKPEVLFSGNYYAYDARAYDVAPDGERFLMVKSDEEENRELGVVLNWFEELKRLAPAGQ